MKIEVTSNPSREISQALSDGIVDFNHTMIPELEPNEAEVRFHVVATDAQGGLAGGLRASCYWNTLHIELLWLSQNARGTGLGSEIVATAEHEARGLGCGKALVETTSWQARPFHEKQGYVLLATLPDRPRGHASHYLSKSLD